MILMNISKSFVKDMLRDSEDNGYNDFYNALNDALNDGYRFYVVEQTRGRCYFARRVITIPKWAIVWNYPSSESLAFRIWYLSHELAHYKAWKNNKHLNHGAAFMQELLKICPKHCLHYETCYKPKNANSAGISKSMHVNTGTVPDGFFD